MSRVLVVGNRAIQHSVAVRLTHENCLVDVYPGQDFGGYRVADAASVGAASYDLVVAGSARYFDDRVVANALHRGSRLFGPDPDAARLETSKSFFKQNAERWGVLVPHGHTFEGYDLAVKHLASVAPPYVIKADGPARGCGVTICRSRAEAEIDLSAKLRDIEHPSYCGRVVIEEFIEGEEVACNIILDGDSYLILPPTRPHKRRLNGDTGPNVAGMGSVAPVLLNNIFYSQVVEQVIKPTMAGVRKAGWYFRGCLFANFMLTEKALYTLEFNCRMGDPAMLVDLLLLGSSLSELLLSSAENRLSEYVPQYREGIAIAVTLVDPGYPEHSLIAQPLYIPRTELVRPGVASGLVIAGAETLTSDERALRVTGGVVASSIALGEDLTAARAEAYRRAALVEHVSYRSDIGLNLGMPTMYSSNALRSLGSGIDP